MKSKEDYRGREINAHEASRRSLIELSAFSQEVRGPADSPLAVIFSIVAIANNS